MQGLRFASRGRRLSTESRIRDLKVARKLAQFTALAENTVPRTLVVHSAIALSQATRARDHFAVSDLFGEQIYFGTKRRGYALNLPIEGFEVLNACHQNPLTEAPTA